MVGDNLFEGTGSHPHQTVILGSESLRPSDRMRGCDMRGAILRRLFAGCVHSERLFSQATAAFFMRERVSGVGKRVCSSGQRIKLVKTRSQSCARIHRRTHTHIRACIKLIVFSSFFPRLVSSCRVGVFSISPLVPFLATFCGRSCCIARWCDQARKEDQGKNGSEINMHNKIASDDGRRKEIRGRRGSRCRAK